MSETTHHHASRSGESVQQSPSRRAGVILVLAFLTPLVTWGFVLAQSYIITDFTCIAVGSAAAPIPHTGLPILLHTLNATMLALTVLAGWIGWRALRQATHDNGDGEYHSADDSGQVTRFLGWGAVALALLFGFGIIMIAATPIFLEVCI